MVGVNLVNNNISSSSIWYKSTEVKPNPSLSSAWPSSAPACFFVSTVVMVVVAVVVRVYWVLIPCFTQQVGYQTPQKWPDSCLEYLSWFFFCDGVIVSGVFTTSDIVSWYKSCKKYFSFCIEIHSLWGEEYEHVQLSSPTSPIFKSLSALDLD